MAGDVGELLEVGVRALELRGADLQLGRRRGQLGLGLLALDEPAQLRPIVPIRSMSAGSGSWICALKKSTAPTISPPLSSGSPMPPCSPLWAAAPPRGKLGSAPASRIHTGSPLAHTRPGRPSPRSSAISMVARRKASTWAPASYHAARQRTCRPSGSGVHRPPTCQPMLSAMAARKRGSGVLEGRALGEHGGDEELGRQVALGALALAEVADHAREGAALAAAPLAERELEREFRPVAAQSDQLDRAPDDVRAAGLENTARIPCGDRRGARSGMSVATSLPRMSSGSYPNMVRARSFQNAMRPSSSAETIASLADSATVSKRRTASQQLPLNLSGAR